MRRVVRVSLREAFKSGVSSDVPAPFLLKHRHLLNPTVFALLVWTALLLSSPFSRLSLIGLTAFSAFLGFLFLDLKAKAESLVISRVRSRGRMTVYQGDRVQAGFEVHNIEAGACRVGAVVEDHFGPSKNSTVYLAAELNIAGRSKVFIGEERVCDAEMGEKTLGPMRLRLRDLFGIFEFQVIEDEASVVELLPRVKPVPSLEVSGSASSLHYGLYEVPARGLSVNFSGIRSYVHGDSLRHIAWKKSAKRDGLMVKEFEKVVSCDLTLVLDMSPLLHVGSDHDSSWETAKLVTLGVAKQQLDLGNSIQFVSNGVFLPPTRGNDFFRLLMRTVTHLHPAAVAVSASGGLVDQADEQIASGSTLILISVFDASLAERDFVRLCALRDRGVQVFVFFLDPSSFLLGQHEMHALSFLGVAKTPASLSIFETRLRAAGIDVQVIRRGEQMARWFARRAS